MRTVVDFNTKWAFTKQAGRIPEELPQNWYWVNLPHTWNAIDGQDGGNDYYRGTCYYANKICRRDLPDAECYYLEIPAANSSADVYVNGKHLAHHDGGYSNWRVNITPVFADENLVVIAVDNAPNETVYPQTADFTFYGGLYRGLHVICTSRSHFDLDCFGGPGLKVTPVIDGASASVSIEAYVTNREISQSLRYTIFDSEGQEVCKAESRETVVSLRIENVHRWNGRKDPYLYTAKVELVDDGAVIDTVSSRFGCRTFQIDPERGFILNGEEYPLRGVSRHQDRWGIGNALLPEHHREDMDLICELGATTVRLAHYQHSQVFYDLCDERGIITWVEIPYISSHMSTGRENTISQMKELVIQNYNHPSIVVWGLSNEITMKGEDDPDLIENHRILNDIVHELDKTRLTTIACLSTCKTDCEYIRIPDVISYNHYFGWYGGDTSMYAPWFDKFHAEHPQIAIGCSEYGCEALNWHNSDPDAGDYSEDYQSYFHEEAIKQLFPRKYLWATHVWNMFDFGADARKEGGENGQNHKGLVTMDRKYKKDSFYAYKAWLSDEPFVHIGGKRYVDRVESITKVTVYSNLPEVELFVNGESLGKKTADDHFFRYDVPNVGTSKLLAIAGEYRDESTLRKVDVFNPSYKLTDKNAVLNWFDITEKNGYYSLNNKMKDVMKSPEGRQVLKAEIFDKAVGVTESMFSMFESFTILGLTGLFGSTGLSYTKEQLLAINDKLNQVKAV